MDDLTTRVAAAMYEAPAPDDPNTPVSLWPPRHPDDLAWWITRAQAAINATRTQPSFDAIRADYLAQTSRAYTAEQFDNAVAALIAFAVTQGTRHDEQCETRWVNGEYADCGCSHRNTIKRGQ